MVFPPSNNTTYFSIPRICSPFCLVDFQESSLEPFRVVIFMHVTWNDNTTVCLGVLNKERETKTEPALVLVSFASPHHTKANALFSRAPSEGCNNSAGSTGAWGRRYFSFAPPALDGWSRWRVSTHILPGYEQQICQCVTSWQPRSQLLVQCCYISTLSNYSAKRQSASSIRGRQVASKTRIGFGRQCQNALKRCNLNPSVPLQQQSTGLGSSGLQIRFAKQRR